MAIFNFWSFVRLPILGFVIVSSIIEMGFGGFIVNTSDPNPNVFSRSYGALAVAVAVITLVTVTPMLVIDLLRPGYFVSWVAVELGWFSLLWVLWLATAANASGSNVVNIFNNGCDFIDSTANDVCHVWQGIQAFGYLNWIFLMGYTIALFVFALIAQKKRGHEQVWTASVRDINFFEWNSGASSGVARQLDPEAGTTTPALVMTEARPEPQQE